MRLGLRNLKIRYIALLNTMKIRKKLFFSWSEMGKTLKIVGHFLQL